MPVLPGPTRRAAPVQEHALISCSSCPVLGPSGQLLIAFCAADVLHGAMCSRRFNRSLSAVCFLDIIRSWASEDVRKIRVLLWPAQDEVAILRLRVLHGCTRNAFRRSCWLEP